MVTGIKIGPLTLNFYGLLIMLGVILAAVLSTYEAKRKKQNPEIILDSLTWIVLGGVIGARLWHIFTPPASMVAQGITTQYYLTHPLAAIAIWRGGLGIPGAVAGGALVFYLYAKRRGLKFGLWADIFAPGLALGQSIGRWGNFINQEVYGSPTDLPWAIRIDPQHRLPEFVAYETYHPLFLYESIFNFLNMVFLLWISRKFEDKLKNGDVFLTYLVSYPVFRFFMEFLRLDNSFVGGINANQTLMIVIAVAALGALIWRHRKDAAPREIAVEKPDTAMAAEDDEKN
ncbi:MAG: prolipoprotein diacylglyceryl transferase [Brevefilum sp.]|nr:prolipoprotein diacylglyceryl transferase [Brevefilum sp.]MDT8381166.1 prolipoprotein diacylglyceryl transferase [Brevefilum sp.]MDW7754971.1 prolipoprotein diacylglyceryl transferase [Brevefilum sp.]